MKEKWRVRVRGNLANRVCEESSGCKESARENHEFKAGN